MPLDPQAESVLKMLASTGAPPIESLSPPQAREMMTQFFRPPPGSEEPVGKVENRTVAGPAGPIPVRVYTPQGNGPFPILVFFHGGGFVLGDLDSHDMTCRSLTNQAGCVTVAVDYRLAPEHKFPAAVDDCYAATLWISEHSAEIGGDGNRLAVGGDSAGGNLSAVVSMLARDRGKPAIKFQLLVYPGCDATCSMESHRVNTEYFLTPALIKYFYRHYLRGDEDRKDPRMSIVMAKDFSRLPPALVITAEYDPLRDEGEALAEKLKSAGVPVRMTRYPGQIHGFFTMANFLDDGKKAVSEASEALRRAFGN